MTDEFPLLFPLPSLSSSSRLSTSQPDLVDVIRKIETRPKPLDRSKSLEKLSLDGPREAIGHARKLRVRKLCDIKENGKEKIRRIRKLDICELKQGPGIEENDFSNNIKHVYEGKQPNKGGSCEESGKSKSASTCVIGKKAGKPTRPVFVRSRHNFVSKRRNKIKNKVINKHSKRKESKKGSKEFKYDLLAYVRATLLGYVILFTTVKGQIESLASNGNPIMVTGNPPNFGINTARFGWLARAAVTLHLVTGKLLSSLSDAMPMTCFDFFYCQLFLPCYSFVVKIIYALLCLLITYIASFLYFALKLYGTSTIYFTYLIHWLIPFLMTDHLQNCMECSMA